MGVLQPKTDLPEVLHLLKEKGANTINANTDLNLICLLQLTSVRGVGVSATSTATASCPTTVVRRDCLLATGDSRR